MNEQLLQILKELPFKVYNIDVVSGGDISKAYCVNSTTDKYFLKVNDLLASPGMFEKEVSGLKALAESSSLNIPGIITHGITGNLQYLLLEWLEESKPGNRDMEPFGASLAEMHKIPQPYFGWKEDNYIGSLKQDNTKQQGWTSFYVTCRILPWVEKLYDKGIFTPDDVKATEKLCSMLQVLFPAESASLLHGDLWSGNYMVTPSGVALFDPAVYYGHREMDLGMSRLFGGFPQAFYDGYAEAYPLQPGWEERVELTQLYPLLVHAILFGGSYVHSARNIIKKYSR